MHSPDVLAFVGRSLVVATVPSVRTHPHMTLQTRHANLFDHSADALLLTMDGGDGRVRGGLDAVAGNVTRAFRHRCRDEDGEDGEGYEELEAAVLTWVGERGLVPNGTVIAVEVPVCELPFRGALIASLLTHLGDLSPGAMRDVVALVVENAVLACHARSWATVGSPLLTGGWRLGARDAALAMREGYARGAEAVRGRGGEPVTLTIFERDAEKHDVLADVIVGGA